jgi:carotenoid cleavage dioxygenase
LAARSIYLVGNRRPVTHETSFEGLAVEGAWPEHLQGTLVLVGPNPLHPPRGSYHPFEGSGMVHAVRVHGGQASFRNRFVVTPDFARERTAGQEVIRSMCEPPDLDVLSAGRYPYRNSANAAVLAHAGRIHALGDFHDGTELAAGTFETLGPSGLGVNPGQFFSAHAKLDPLTSDLVYFRTSVRPAVMAVGVIDRNGRPLRETIVALARPRLMHDFAITQHHAVIFDLGVSFDESRARGGMSGWHYDPGGDARIGLLRRDGRCLEPLWFSVDPCVVIHTVNAWESADGGIVTVLAVRYRWLPESLRVGPPAENDPLQPANASRGELCEWAIDLSNGSTSVRVLSSISADFPRIDESWLTQPTRHAWLVAELPNSGLLHVDCGRSVERLYSFGKGKYPSEMVFVARPGAVSEGEGHLLGFVWDARTGLSEAVVFDARNVEAGPVARVRLPVRVPFGFHVTWLHAETPATHKQTETSLAPAT